MSFAEVLILRPAALPPLSRMALRITVLVMTWENRHKTRKHLRKLDHHLLADVGLDQWVAEAEAARPFWRH